MCNGREPPTSAAAIVSGIESVASLTTAKPVYRNSSTRINPRRVKAVSSTRRTSGLSVMNASASSSLAELMVFTCAHKGGHRLSMQRSKNLTSNAQFSRWSPREPRANRALHPAPLLGHITTSLSVMFRTIRGAGCRSSLCTVARHEGQL